MKRRQFSFQFALPQPEFRFDWRAWLPSRGNVLFTLVMIGVLLWAQSAGAVPFRAESAASTGTIAYQGRLADSSGNPLTSTLNMSFRLYNASTGGAPLWTEQWSGPNGVKVSDGLFNVMLGSLTPIAQSVITGNANLFLGITVGTDDEMTPRVQLGSVPFAVQALTVPDGSITTAKLAADVSLVPPANSITTTMLANGAVTTSKLDNNIGVGGSFTVGTLDQGFKFQVSAPQGASNVARIGYYDYGAGTVLSVAPGNVYFDAPGIVGGRLTIDGNTGNVSVGKSFSAGGTKSAVVQTVTYGKRKLYAVEAPDVRFSDEGMAHLQSAQARVALEPIFLETIEGDYLIQITPYGDASLYVAEIGADYFVVKAREGDPNVSFAWRLSATRKGYAGVRLEEVEKTDLQN